MTDKLTDKVVQVREDQSEIIELLRNEKSMTVPVRRVYALNLHLEIERLRAERDNAEDALSSQREHIDCLTAELAALRERVRELEAIKDAAVRHSLM